MWMPKENEIIEAKYADSSTTWELVTFKEAKSANKYICVPIYTNHSFCFKHIRPLSKTGKRNLEDKTDSNWVDDSEPYEEYTPKPFPEWKIGDVIKCIDTEVKSEKSSLILNKEYTIKEIFYDVLLTTDNEYWSTIKFEWVRSPNEEKTTEKEIVASAGLWRTDGGYIVELDENLVATSPLSCPGISEHSKDLYKWEKNGTLCTKIKINKPHLLDLVEKLNYKSRPFILNNKEFKWKDNCIKITEDIFNSPTVYWPETDLALLVEKIDKEISQKPFEPSAFDDSKNPQEKEEKMERSFTLSELQEAAKTLSNAKPTPEKEQIGNPFAYNPSYFSVGYGTRRRSKRIIVLTWIWTCFRAIFNFMVKEPVKMAFRPTKIAVQMAMFLAVISGTGYCGYQYLLPAYNKIREKIPTINIDWNQEKEDLIGKVSD